MTSHNTPAAAGHYPHSHQLQTEDTRQAALAAALSHIAHILTEERPPTGQVRTPAPPERVLLTPEEAGEYLGIGRTTVYALIKSGALESVQIGRLRRIPQSAVHDYTASLIEQSRAQSA